MKKVICFFIIILLSMNAFAQEQESYFASGDKSILFSFRGLDNLGLTDYYNGIGAKYFIDDELAVRVGFQIGGTSTTTPANQDTSENGLDGESSSSIFGISGAIVWHAKNQKFSPFAGAGISLSRSSSESKNAVVWPKLSTGLVTRTTTTTSGGMTYSIFALAGVEIFITKSISITGEYEFAFDHDSSNETKTRVNAIQGTHPNIPNTQTIDGPSSNSYGIHSTGLLIIAIYF